MSSPNSVSLSGMSEGEAQEFHKYYLQGMFLFVAIAVVAHLLVWFWRPWIPGPQGYASLEDVGQTVTALLPTLA
ncbi:light-harvesting antenna LH1, beta subunit [Roseibium sp. RKSG952]|uniref:light-harvesting antenna LH1, beta subunit n=1 Tax=Roseibium sp. RKSG952 TaxID=2529384 RepID=UPI0012BCB198|nr:light-harvesting antenna LH1, beta subunit [Roseibium sp. RKSG952]MTH98780.1 light-harvesting protein [Roseibium sp. RKSG952]